MKPAYLPRRGDIVYLDFDPQSGHEQAGRRPAIVLSPVEYNRSLSLVLVCPITNTSREYPWEVEIPDNEYVSGVVLADQIKSMDWRKRNAEFLCSTEAELLEEVLQKIIPLIQPEEEEE